MSDLELDISLTGSETIIEIQNRLEAVLSKLRALQHVSEESSKRMEVAFENTFSRFNHATSSAIKNTSQFSSSFSSLEKSLQDQIKALVSTINEYHKQAVAIETATKLQDKHTASVATANHLQTVSATKLQEAQNKRDLLNNSEYVGSIRLEEANKQRERAVTSTDRYKGKLAEVTREVEFYSSSAGKKLLKQQQISKNIQELTTASTKYANTLALEIEKNKFLDSAEGRRVLRLQQTNKNLTESTVAYRKFLGELAATRRETHNLTTAQGQNHLIQKQLNENTKAAIVAEAKFSGEIEKQARITAQLSTDKGRQLLVDKQLQKNTEEAVTSNAKYAGQLEKLSRHAAYLATADGQRAVQLAQLNKNTERALTYNERLAADMQKVAEVTKRLNSEEGQQLIRAEQVNKNKAEAITLSTRLANSLELEKIRQDFLNSETGEAATRLKALNEIKRQTLVEDIKRNATLQSTIRELEFETSAAGKNLAMQKELLRVRRQLNAENARKMVSSGVGLAPSAAAISAWDRFRKSTLLAQQATAGLRAGFTGFGASFGIYTSSTIAFAAAVYGLSRALRTTLTTGKNFESSMARAISAMDVTQGSRLEITNRVRSIAAETVFTASESAEGMQQLALAGLRANDAMSALPASLRLASIGLLDMGTTADIVTNILMGMGLEVEHLPEVVDDMATAVVSSNMIVQQLGLAMSYVAPIARDANMSFQELTASLEVLHNAGIKSQRAGTALRTSILSLMSPAKEARDIMEEYNITIDDSSGVMRDWTEILEKFRKANLSLSSVESLVGKRQASAFSALLKASTQVKVATGEYDEYGNAIMRTTTQLRDLTEELHSNRGASAAMQSIIEDNLEGDWKKLLAAIEEQMLAFYASNADGLRKLVKGATDFVIALDAEAIDDFFSRAISGAKTLLATLISAKTTMMFLSATSGVGNKGVGAVLKYGAAAAIGTGTYMFANQQMDNIAEVMNTSGSKSSVSNRSGSFTNLRGKSDQDIRDIRRFHEDNIGKIASKIQELEDSLDTLYYSPKTTENLAAIEAAWEAKASQELALINSQKELANTVEVMRADNIFRDASEAARAADIASASAERLLRTLNNTETESRLEELIRKMGEIRAVALQSKSSKGFLEKMESPEDLVRMTPEERRKANVLQNQTKTPYVNMAEELDALLTPLQDTLNLYDKVVDRQEEARRQAKELVELGREGALKASQELGENKVAQEFSDLAVDLSKLYQVEDVYGQLVKNSSEINKLESERAEQLAGALLERKQKELGVTVRSLSAIGESLQTEEDKLALLAAQAELAEVNAKILELSVLPSESRSKSIAQELLSLHTADYGIRRRMLDAATKENDNLIEGVRLGEQGLEQAGLMLELFKKRTYVAGKAGFDYLNEEASLAAASKRLAATLEIEKAEKALADFTAMGAPLSSELLKTYTETENVLRSTVALKKEELGILEKSIELEWKNRVAREADTNKQSISTLKEDFHIRDQIDSSRRSGNLWVSDAEVASARKLELALSDVRDTMEVISRMKAGEIDDSLLEDYTTLLATQATLATSINNDNSSTKASEILKIKTEAYKASAETLYETINSSTLSFLKDGAKDSSEFFDGILKSFKDMLIEMAYEAAIKPIITSVFSGAIGGVTGSDKAATDFAASKGETPTTAGGDPVTGLMGSLSSIPVAGWAIAAVGVAYSVAQAHNKKEEAKFDKYKAENIQATQFTGTVLGDLRKVSESLQKLVEMYRDFDSSLIRSLERLNLSASRGLISVAFDQINRNPDGIFNLEGGANRKDFGRAPAPVVYNSNAKGLGLTSLQTDDTYGFLSSDINSAALLASSYTPTSLTSSSAVSDFGQRLVAETTLINKALNPSLHFGGSATNKVTDKISNSLFGTKTKLLNTGISFAGQSLGDIDAEGLLASVFSDVQTTKKVVGIKSSKKRRYSEGLDSQTATGLEGVLLNSRDFMLGISDSLDLDFGSKTAEKFINSFTLPFREISTQGMDRAQASEAIQGWLNATTDIWAEQLVAGAGFTDWFHLVQESGEGAMQTLGRVAIQMQIWNDMAETLGSSMSLTHLAGAELAQSLIDAAGSLQELMQQAEEFFNLFYSDEERFIRLGENVKAIFDEFDEAVPNTREGFRELVNGIEHTGLSSVELYQALLELAPEMDNFYSYIEQLQEIGGNFKVNLLKAAGDDLQARAMERAKELEALDGMFVEAQTQLWLLQDLQTIYEDYNNSLESSKTYLTDFTKRIQDFVTSLSTTQKGLGSPIDIYAAARAEYEQTLTLAKTGDKDALDSAIANAENYLESVKNLYGSGEFAQAIIRRMKEELLELPTSITEEDLLSSTIKDSTQDLITYLEQSTGLQLDSLEAIKAALDNAILFAREYDPIANVESDIPKFARGGVFTNGIVSTPTKFSMGLMGEAGAEAIMPLTTTSTGDLGVRIVLPNVSTSSDAESGVVSTLRGLREELRSLRLEQQKILAVIASNTEASVRVQQYGFAETIKSNNDIKVVSEESARIQKMENLRVGDNR